MCVMLTGTCKQPRKQKPKRPCVYCGEFRADIRAHLLSAHKDEDSVKALQNLTRNDRLKAIDKLRKEGMYKHNQTILATGGTSEDLISERASCGKKVICGGCHGTFNALYFYKHKHKCQSPNPASATMRTEQTESFPAFTKLLETMDRDIFFDIIKKDTTIKLIGKHFLDSAKPSKVREARMKARAAMRRLARLVHATDGVSEGRGLFQVSNFYRLQEAIKALCQAEDSMKSGLKVALGTLIRKSTKIVFADCIIQGDDKTATDIGNFEKIFNLNYSNLFSDAEYNLKERRQRVTRKPNSLPNEEEFVKLRSYLCEEIKALSKGKEITKSEYIRLRKCTLTRLTLLNGRRGSELAKMLIKDFEEKDTWINKENLEEADKELTRKYSLAYVMGKGSKLVPILIPNDCLSAVNILVDPLHRKEAGINPCNSFVFAYTKDSDLPTIGYNETRDVCEALGLPVITATSVRHRSSTIFWSMEHVEENVINQFMDHMGHARDIDKNIYAVPPALNTLKTIAPIITQMDQVHM